MRVRWSFPVWRILVQFSEVRTALVGQPLLRQMHEAVWALRSTGTIVHSL